MGRTIPSLVAICQGSSARRRGCRCCVCILFRELWSATLDCRFTQAMSRPPSWGRFHLGALYRLGWYVEPEGMVSVTPLSARFFSSIVGGAPSPFCSHYFFARVPE